MPESTCLEVVGGFPSSADATMVATLLRTGVASPLPSGWTRLLRKMTAVWDAGSNQIEVPVKPVWPKVEPLGKSSPRFELKAVSQSQLKVRHPLGTALAWVMVRMLAWDKPLELEGFKIMAQ